MERYDRADFYDVIVVGAGPSGLSAAYYLKQHGIDYRVLERKSLLTSWRHERWDSFTLVTPNWMTRLPGMEDAVPKDNAYMTLDEINALLTEWVGTFEPAVLEGVEVTGLKCLSPEEAKGSEAGIVVESGNRARFELETNVGKFWARHVIVACGQYNKPFIPKLSKVLPEEILQLHSVGYKNPCQLKEGGVLVVGGGRSGIQIALELRRTGRCVWLSLGTQRPIPDAYDNVSGVYWLNRLSGFAQRDRGLAYTAEELKRLDIVAKMRQTLATCQMEGVELIGRLTGFEEDALIFSPNLIKTMKDGEVYLTRFRAEIEAHVEAAGLEKPDMPISLNLPTLDLESLKEGPERLPMSESGIATIIWATGFRPDYQWIDAPVFDAERHLIHRQGISDVDGLYFTGVELNPGFGGPSAYGIGFYSFAEDAKRMVERIHAELED
jgi:putative flavoprotein involved in K+ transport